MKAFAKTDIGKAREINQDYYYIPTTDKLDLYILADGMGGYNGGEVASKLAIDSVKKYIENNFEKEKETKESILNLIKSAIEYANMIVYKKSKEVKELEGMGTTLDVCLIYNNKVRFVHPAGFLNSNDKNNKDTIEWMNNVDMILMDEGENVSGSLNTIINKYCKNARIFYSFCGTADRFNNWKLSYENLQGRLHMLHQETLNLMYYFGTVNVYKTLPKKLNINRTYLPLPQEEKLFDWQQMQAVPKAVENVFNSDAFYQYLDYILFE